MGVAAGISNVFRSAKKMNKKLLKLEELKMATNPMHQFEVYKIGPEINLGNINLSYTNASLFMTISAILILSLLFFGTKKKSLIPSKIQLVTELSYTFEIGRAHV